MEEEELSSGTLVLDKLIAKINSLTRQWPREFRTNKNKVRYSRSAVIK